MTDKKSMNIFDVSNINLNEVNAVESLISKILIEDNFNKLNYLQNEQTCNKYSKFEANLRIAENNENIEFIAYNENLAIPYSTIITEQEFYKIVGLTKNGLSKRSGMYQESLYSFYQQAVKECDTGFISDILNKAVIFNNNLNYVKTLMKNKKFMNNWRKNFAAQSPVNVFKKYGNLREINIVMEKME